MKNFKKKSFPSSHVSVNLPPKTLNLRPLDKMSLKNGFLVEKSHFFVKFFRDIFFKSTTCAPAAAGRKIGGRAAKSPLRHCLESK